jgi:hypothetical protein
VNHTGYGRYAPFRTDGGYLIPEAWRVDVERRALAHDRLAAHPRAFSHINDNGSDALMKAQGMKR